MQNSLAVQSIQDNKMKNKKAIARDVILWIILAILGLIALALLNIEARDLIIANFDKINFFGN